MTNRRGPWSQAEDEKLLAIIKHRGAMDWVQIAKILGCRTAKQCRERFHQNLKPTLNHGPITEEEGREIERLVQEIGKRWAEIARRLKERSDNSVKNWYNGSQNRRRRLERRQQQQQEQQRQQQQLHEVSYGFDERAADREHHYAARHVVSIHSTANMSMAIAVPRTMPTVLSPRPPPPPGPLQANNLHEGHYCIETPLSSPSVYSPHSELAPSFVSDCGSHYSTSPQCYDANVELPPLHLLPTGGHFSPRSSHSPTETKLPSIRDMSLAPGPGPLSTSYSTSPESIPGNPDLHHRWIAPLSSPDYFSHRNYLPTAPSSPSSALPHRPVGASHGQQPRTEERTTRSPLTVANLLRN